MPDSPRCFKCLSEGKIGQTYRIVKTRNYKCQSCGQITNHDQYESLDFDWRGNAAWIEKMTQRMKATNSKIGMKRLQELKTT